MSFDTKGRGIILNPFNEVYFHIFFLLFECFERVNPETGIIDYEDLARLAGLFKPAMLVCGGSAYPREWDYAKFREIADANGALLLW